MSVCQGVEVAPLVRGGITNVMEIVALLGHTGHFLNKHTGWLLPRGLQT